MGLYQEPFGMSATNLRTNSLGRSSSRGRRRRRKKKDNSILSLDTPVGQANISMDLIANEEESFTANIPLLQVQIDTINSSNNNNNNNNNKKEEWLVIAD